MGIKQCSRCRKVKNLADFRRSQRKDREWNSMCNECIDKIPPTSKDQYRARNLKCNYGMTPEEYEIWLEKQDGVCAICEQPCSTGKRLCVDHDHFSGAFRGLLCRKCNSAIGYLNDNPALVRRALEYLTG